MSVNEPMIFLANAPEFTFPVGEFIALEVAKGFGIGTLHDAYPDRVPNPIIVRRWAKNIVPFKLLMEEAEAMRAERLADETVTISDDDKFLAADKAQRIKARQWLAGKLHDRYGSGADAKAGGDINIGLILTDDQLMAIAAQGLPAPEVLEGESERLLSLDEKELPAPVVEADMVEADREGGFPVGVDEGEPAEGEPDPYDF